jgi:hypothetical protein
MEYLNPRSVAFVLAASSFLNIVACGGAPQSGSPERQEPQAKALRLYVRLRHSKG